MLCFKHLAGLMQVHRILIPLLFVENDLLSIVMCSVYKKKSSKNVFDSFMPTESKIEKKTDNLLISMS